MIPMKKLTVMNATREELLALPHREWGDTSPTYDSVLIFSTGEKHDSGWDMMAIVGCRDREPVEVCATCCDDIHWKIEPAIMRYGPEDKLTLGQYRMDCAPASGGLHACVRTGKWRVGPALSSTEIILLPYGKIGEAPAARCAESTCSVPVSLVEKAIRRLKQATRIAQSSERYTSADDFDALVCELRAHTTS